MTTDKRIQQISFEDYRNAPSGVGPLASTWTDKPHRLVYDLLDQLAAEKQAREAVERENARLNNLTHTPIGTLWKDTADARLEIMQQLRTQLAEAEAVRNAALKQAAEAERGRDLQASVIRNIKDQRDWFRKALNEIHSWLICYAMITPEDMAQSFKHMEKVANEALYGKSAPARQCKCGRGINGANGCTGCNYDPRDCICPSVERRTAAAPMDADVPDLSQPYEGALVPTETTDRTAPATFADGASSMLDSIRASLHDYPHGGGDIGVMTEVDRLCKKSFADGYRACKEDAEKALWARVEREEYGHAKAAVTLDIEAISALPVKEGSDV